MVSMRIRILVPAGIVLAAAILFAMMGGSCSGARGGAPFRILMITVSGLRADRLGYSGYNMSTPAVDSLAKRGVVFLNSYSNSDMTVTSHLAILSSLYVKQHSPYFYDCSSGITPVFLQRLLKSHGFFTGAIVANPLLRKETFRGAQDFDRYYATTSFPVGRVAEDNNLWVLSFLEECRTRKKWFLWVNYADTADPYSRRPVMEEGQATSGASDQASRFYDESVGYVDESLRRLLAVMGESGFLKNTIVLFTADHGEGLGEHKIRQQHLGLFEEMIHVPLILSCPGKISAGRRVSSLVMGVDIAPTILELAGIEKPTGMQGKSLVPLFSGKEVELHPEIYAESYLQKVSMVRSGPWKYMEYADHLYSREFAEAWRAFTIKDPMAIAPLFPGFFFCEKGARKLYNLDTDPGEKKDVLLQKKDLAISMEEKLERWYQGCLKRKEKERTFPDPLLDERLKVMGY